MFKKLMSFLFEEEGEEVYADDELEDVVLSSEPLKEKKVRKEQPSRPAPARERIRVESADPKPVKKVVEQPLPPKEPVRHMNKINLTEEPSKPQRSARTKSSETSKKDAKSEFEFSPVLSPIFGSNDTSETSSTDKASLKLNTTSAKTKKKNPLGTIISPMYGATELDVFEHAAKEKIEEEKLEPKPEEILEEKSHEETMMDMIDTEDPHMENFPLEDMIKTEEEKEDDTMQISLFGDDAPISEDMAESKLSIKE